MKNGFRGSFPKISFLKEGFIKKFALKIGTEKTTKILKEKRDAFLYTIPSEENRSPLIH